ncbi:MotA/TolQ/ExbB proton channel family protein [Arthrobacter sp. GCM10027362]|uniref:MotA/TolQ/ExbB proton channel family protein n=1 Tax=Arthrobacter sp. GCM10027362 TaxID=3273379 RepID=UPI0036338DE2
MRWKDFLGSVASLATAVGLIGTVVGLGLVLVQLREVEKQLQSGSAQTVTNQLLELDRELQELGPDERACFIRESVGTCPVLQKHLTQKSAAEPTPKPSGQKSFRDTVEKVRAVAVEHLDLFDSVLAQVDYLNLRDEPILKLETSGAPGDGWNGWSNYMQRTMQASEVMCQVLRDDMNMYASNLVDGLDWVGKCGILSRNKANGPGSL